MLLSLVLPFTCMSCFPAALELLVWGLTCAALLWRKNLSKLSQNKTINSPSKRDCMPFSSNDLINTKTLKFAKDIRN